ncbi:MAG: cysteine desulfurase [Eubacteriaceae bacterium]|jgi:cysteine desulfurase|nr:cysteine desulfurase [Eubacteriaceae bacterium]
MDNRIYVDNSATTRVSKTAMDAMLPCFCEDYGNPSSIHSFGQEAKKKLEASRSTVAKAIGAHSTEIYFTSGGTESDNWALHAACAQRQGKGRHIVSTAIEHSAILQTLDSLKARGFEVTLLNPDKNGQISPNTLENALRNDTILISAMLANNVVGTVLDIKALASVAKRRRILFHTDAVQAVGHIPVSVREIGCDLLSLSSHKFHGPKGAGALFARIGLFPQAFMTGGGQERGARSGTENIPGIVGMAAALQESVAQLSESVPYLSGLRDKFVEGALKIAGVQLTGDPVSRLPGHASFVIEGIGHSALLIGELNDAGICAGTGSACSQSSNEAPHVLTAVGIEGSLSNEALRVSFSVYNTEEEADRMLAILPAVVERLRKKKKAALV